MQKEIWKDVSGYVGVYQISNLGKFKSLDRYVKKHDGLRLVKGKVIKQRINNSGYYRVGLCKSSKSKGVFIHRLLAEAFIPNPENKPCVNHINGIKTDNRIDNLEWCTMSENSKHAVKMGLLKCYLPDMNNVHGSSHPSSKPVLQFNINGEFIREFDNAIEVKKELNFSNTHVSSCCNGRLKHAYGFIWRFKPKLMSIK